MLQPKIFFTDNIFARKNAEICRFAAFAFWSIIKLGRYFVVKSEYRIGARCQTHNGGRTQPKDTPSCQLVLMAGCQTNSFRCGQSNAPRNNQVDPRCNLDHLYEAIHRLESGEGKCLQHPLIVCLFLFLSECPNPESR